MDRKDMSAGNRLGRYALHLTIAALILLTLISYRHITRNGFVFDDGFYLVQNSHVQEGIGPEAVKWAFTAFYGANWQPLTWLSSMLDYRMYGPNPVGHHATSLIFHIANTILLLLVLRRMTGSLWKSALVAAVFALHPLHVESVAWASERKDVLSTFLMLVAIWAYVRYAEDPSVRRYLLVAGALALGLMAKPMLVSLPILLLLLDFWPLRRFRSTPPQPSPQRGGSTSSHAGNSLPVAGRVGEGLSRTAGRPLKASPTADAVSGRPLKASPTALIMEKATLFALSLGSCVITYLAQQSGGAVILLDKFPLGLRIANSLVAYLAYIGKTIFPTGLAAYYPYPRDGVPALTLAIVSLVIVGVSALVVRQAKSRPYLAVGWLWYVISLIPVIGLVQVGEQSMADRYMYIPLIGLAIMVAWGVPDLLRQHLDRPIAMGLAGVSVLAVIAMGVATSAQVGYWESNYTLFRRAASVTSGGALVFSNYGLALAERDEYDQAIEQYEKAIGADPYYVQSYLNLGNAFKDQGDADAALLQYAKALDINPDYTDASLAAASTHNDLGLELVRQGDAKGARDHFERAIELDPDCIPAHGSLAIAYFTAGQYAKAWEEVRFVESRGADLPPGFVDALAERMPPP